MKKFLENLLKYNLLKNNNIDYILNLYQKSQEKDIIIFLYNNNFIETKTYLKLMSDKYQIETIEKLEKLPSLKNIKIPFKFLREFNFLVYKQIENTIYIIISNPKKLNFTGLLTQYYPGKNFKYILTTENYLKKILLKLEEEYNFQENIEKIRKELTNENLIADENESGTLKLIKLILDIAINKGTSDIHIEAEEKEGKIRFRILGTLIEYSRIDKTIYNALISRIKILCKLDISNKFTPQDGAFSMKINDNPFDFRVSILPTVNGESCVIRILNKQNILKKIEDIGISEFNLEKIKNLINSPNGIFLVTGPTGSGKSTTLYAVLNSLDKEKYKIITVEDPVEYKLEGIEQVQVNPKMGLTFASALRSILRQDPDIIMIGEIRDKETLEIAIKAALTGHLVISTLHTNDAISAINRMIDMGVDSYLVASALIGVEAQRLVKTICPYCKEEYTPNPNLLKIVKPFIPKGKKFYKGKGCEKCNMTGYSGRTLITEVFIKDSILEEMIIKNESKIKLEEYLKNEKNFNTMFFDGINKVLKEETTIEEVFKVAKLNE